MPHLQYHRDRLAELKTTMKTLTNKQIREVLLSDSNNLKVRISRSGWVYVLTNRDRGDGGKRPWWMMAGTRVEVSQQA